MPVLNLNLMASVDSDLESLCETANTLKIDDLASMRLQMSKIVL